jgi:hypothetical protein
MKRLFYMTLIALISCEKPREAVGDFPPALAENITPYIYEGRVPLSDESSLYMEITMTPENSMGDGDFRMQEFVETESGATMISSFTGKYSSLPGETPDERIVQFHNSSHDKGVKRTYLAPGFKGNITDSRLTMIREEPFRTTDLTARVMGRNKLILLGDRLETISKEPEDNLVRRASKLFTVEGYFRHTGDSADFFEMNTGESWAISKYGEYRKAIRQYHQLTTTKFELTYLKGVGFSIRHPGKDGKEIDALVIKKVLQMTPASGLQEN